MKIIGRADGDALVVQMDTRELARICGYHYADGDFTKYLKSVGAIKYGSGDTPAHALADLIANHSPAVIVPQAKEPTS